MTTVIGFASAPISIPLVLELTAARRTGRGDERRLLSSVLAPFSPAGAVMLTVGVTALAASVGLNYLLGFVWGLGAFGLAVASSIAAFISVTALYLIYRRMYAKVGWGLLVPAVIRIGVATTAMSAAIWLLREHLHVLPLIALASLTYMGTMLALQDSEARSYMRLVLSLPARLRRTRSRP